VRDDEGVVVTAFASAPVRAVVNVDQSLRFSDFASALRPLEGDLRGDGFHRTLAATFASMNGPLLPEADRARLAAHRTAARQDVVLGVWDLVFASSDAELDALAASVGGHIEAPYLALHGMEPGADYDGWLGARLPTATVERWVDHGHYPHLVDPDRFAARLLDLLA
jgi:pimeloyl-ACP methyl ester carboxylesterase